MSGSIAPRAWASALGSRCCWAPTPSLRGPSRSDANIGGMAVRPVLKMGHPVLRQVASPVLRFDGELKSLVSDMDDTMRSLSGAGIAAPQIGVSQRVVIFEVQEN